MITNKPFAGIPEEFTDSTSAKIVLIPVPYDGTSTWQKGADKGYDAFIEASENMELYDIETQSEVYKIGIYSAEALNDFSSPKTMVDSVFNTVDFYLKQNKFVTLFGGEHSISIGAIQSFNKHFNNLTVLHIDAHADLRATYDGTEFNHACAVYQASKTTNLIQVGIRSMDVSELEAMNTDKVFFAHELPTLPNWKQDAIDKMTDNVFITFDLDALDPAIMPSTGTPEPGGLFWNDTLSFLKAVFKQKNVVGFDIVELCPNEANKAPDFLAAKLYYKMLSYKFNTNKLKLNN